MKKDFNILPLVFALAILSFSACGVKKNATAEVSSAKTTQPATTEQTETATDKSLAQRIAAGEFSWLDTIQVDTAKFSKLVGTYKLAYQKDLYGNNLTIEKVYADSLILSYEGFYWLYKNNSLVDYGKYNISPYQRAIKICMEQYNIDPKTMMYSDEIITYEGYWGVWGGSQIYFTFISHNTTKTTYLGLYSYSNNFRFKLHFDVKMGDCYHYQWSGSNQIEWIRTS